MAAGCREQRVKLIIEENTTQAVIYYMLNLIMQSLVLGNTSQMKPHAETGKISQGETNFHTVTGLN